ncbi:MAG: helix-turn-helix transcriptional regulator [Lachnospiraceae bacterium]|nr:helix-turn-helix transcriptional regulator [Lachnospiraceae bacterium]
MIDIDKDNTEKTKVLASRLKELRESLNLTIADFSKSLDLKPQTYSAYEKAVNKPPIDVLIKIAERHNASIDWLCGFSNTSNKKIDLDTYADILRLIFELGFVDGVELNSSFCKFLNNDAIFPFEVENYKDVMMLYINDTRINDALKKWKKMFDLFKSGVIDEDVYRLWIEKTLPEYNSFYSADKNLITPENNPAITYKL